MFVLFSNHAVVNSVCTYVRTIKYIIVFANTVIVKKCNRTETQNISQLNTCLTDLAVFVGIVKYKWLQEKIISSHKLKHHSPSYQCQLVSNGNGLALRSLDASISIFRWLDVENIIYQGAIYNVRKEVCILKVKTKNMNSVKIVQPHSFISVIGVQVKI